MQSSMSNRRRLPDCIACWFLDKHYYVQVCNIAANNSMRLMQPEHGTAVITLHSADLDISLARPEGQQLFILASFCNQADDQACHMPAPFNIWVSVSTQHRI